MLLVSESELAIFHWLSAARARDLAYCAWVYIRVAFASIYSWLSVVVGRLALVLTENVTKLLLLPLCNFRMSSHLLTIETPIFFLQLWADYLFNEMLIYIGQFICENICLFKSHIKKIRSNFHC